MSTREGLRSYVSELGERVDYLGDLGLEVPAASEGRAVLTADADDRFRDAATGYVQGGVTATVVDVAGGLALRSTFDAADGPGLLTITLDTTYLEPAGDALRAEASVASLGSQVGVSTVSVTSRGSDTEVATAQATYRVFR